MVYCCRRSCDKNHAEVMYTLFVASFGEMATSHVLLLGSPSLVIGQCISSTMTGYIYVRTALLMKHMLLAM